MILLGRWVVPVSSPYFENGAVVVEQDKILDFGPSATIQAKYRQHQIRSYPDAAILPGFVNVHTHLELTVLRGYLENLPFWNWIQKLTRTKYQVLTYDELVVSALLGAVEAIRAGITTVADPMDLGASLEAVLTSGLRAVLYQECFSPREEEADQVLERLQRKVEELKEKVNRWPEDALFPATDQSSSTTPSDTERPHTRLTLGVSPHAPYTVSRSLFQKVHTYARTQKIPVCIHAAESRAEIQLLEKGLGPIMQSYRTRGVDWQPPECSPVQYLHRLGVITDSTLLVHCVHLTDHDYKLIESEKASVAHCPKSNWKLGHGYMNLKAMRQRQIRLGLGTDSVASNNNMDLFEEMRFALFNPSWLEATPAGSGMKASILAFGAEDALRLATLGGAEALGMSSKIGSIEIGKQADLVAIDLSQPHTLPVFSPVTALVLSARASDVRMTMVGGELLLEEGKMQRVSEPMLCRAVEKIREKMLNAPG